MTYDSRTANILIVNKGVEEIKFTESPVEIYYHDTSICNHTIVVMMVKNNRELHTNIKYSSVEITRKLQALVGHPYL